MSDHQVPKGRFTRFGWNWISFSLLLTTLLVGLTWLFAPSPTPIPAFDQVRSSYVGSEAVLLDRNHHVLHELRINPNARRLQWVGLKEVSPALIRAVIFAEDKRFDQHQGIDWRALTRVTVGFLSFEDVRGASTITMQLASELLPRLRPKTSHRSLWQKWKQIRAAWDLERSWSKQEILEAYLNLVTFRGELQGVTTASRGLFAKNPHGLDSCESVILASLLRSPNSTVERVASRACQLAESMNLDLGCDVITSRVKQTLSDSYAIRPEIALAPHVAWQLLQPGGSKGHYSKRVCTLDLKLQRFATETLQQHLLSVQKQNVRDGAVLVADNESGEVLAYVGGVGAFSSARYVDGVQAKRQAGSILKPFLYGLAFAKLLVTPASLLADAPLDLPAVNGIYRPENYDKQFRGLVAARTALASSLNIPAVKVLNMMGVDSFVQELRGFGFERLQSPEFYGPSLALGSADVTLWELVNAYRALANRGVWSPLRLTFDGKTESARRQALSPGATFMVSDILSDRESRSETFHLESPLATRFWTAVKTGTSKDMRDNWCVGFSNRYTVGVWAGNFSGEPMWNVSGVTGAAPVWIEIVNWLHHDLHSKAPTPPPGVVSRNIELSVLGYRRREWFLKGTETSMVKVAANQSDFRIVYPTSGTIVALDPDIPKDQQKLFFESQPEGAGLQWRLDGERIGPTESVRLWSPQRGKHMLELIDETSRVLDSVSFEVRGNLDLSSNALGGGDGKEAN